jgi:predicted membrane channel-forming protein YqfA (hemolysin III family)
VSPLTPSGRALAGIGLILLLIALWAVLIASLSPVVGRWPIPAQTLFYVVVGIVWIIPLKPLVRWVVTGAFRAPRN